MPSYFSFCVARCLCIVGGAVLPACGQDPGLAPLVGDGQRFSVAGEFSAGVEMSGLASVDGRQFVFVSNETRSAQLGVVDFAGGKITVGGNLGFLLAPGDAEMDLEAVACDPATGTYFVTASHAVSKKKGKPRAEQQLFFKFKLDAAGAMKDYEMGSLTPVFKATPQVSGQFGQPLQQNGVNIEGLAFWKGKLWVGLRAPQEGTMAYILEIPGEAPFATEAAPAVVHVVALGKSRGIRDMAVVQDGLLLVSGESGAPAKDKFPASPNWSGDEKFSLWHWQGPVAAGQSAVVELAKLPKEPGSVEGLYVVSESEQAYKVLLLRDGQPNGGPTLVSLPKPNPKK